MIPRSFKLAGRRWQVRRVTRKGMNRLTRKLGATLADGLCDPNKARIYLPLDLKGELLEIGFEHELEHAIRFTRGETDHDEIAVDGVAHLRHQFHKSSRGQCDAA